MTRTAVPLWIILSCTVGFLWPLVLPVLLLLPPTGECFSVGGMRSSLFRRHPKSFWSKQFTGSIAGAATTSASWISSSPPSHSAPTYSSHRFSIASIRLYSSSSFSEMSVATNETSTSPTRQYTDYEKWVRRLYMTNLFHPVKMGLANMQQLHDIMGNPMDDVSGTTTQEKR